MGLWWEKSSRKWKSATFEHVPRTLDEFAQRRKFRTSRFSVSWRHAVLCAKICNLWLPQGMTSNFRASFSRHFQDYVNQKCDLGSFRFNTSVKSVLYTDKKFQIETLSSETVSSATWRTALSNRNLSLGWNVRVRLRWSCYWALFVSKQSDFWEWKILHRRNFTLTWFYR